MMEPPQQINQRRTLPSLKNNFNLLKNLINNSSNPTSFVQNLIMNNPKVKPIMESFNSSGMSPKQYFYHYAKQQGIDPDQFLNS